MANAVMIIGESGSGKSASIRNLNPETTFIINVLGKALPFRSTGYTLCDPSKEPKTGNVFNTDNTKMILNVLKYVSEHRPEIKVIVLDDLIYAATNEFMRRAKEKSFDKFTDIGQNMWLLGDVPNKLRPDLTLFYLTHGEEDVDSEGRRFIRPKSLGKLIREKITFEGMFTTVLMAEKKIESDKVVKHLFKTQNEGESVAKSPVGMFDELYIENDLLIVDSTIREYYNIK